MERVLALALIALGTVAGVSFAASGSGNAPLGATAVPCPLKGGCTKAGTPGNDVLRGTAQADKIFGFAGNDRIYGLAGNDGLGGGAGDDWLYGGPGNDVIDGGTGSDHLFGDSGNDHFYARNHDRDIISCGSGNDTAIADAVDVVAKDCEIVKGQ